jgi:hypothetical protein
LDLLGDTITLQDFKGWVLANGGMQLHWWVSRGRGQRQTVSPQGEDVRVKHTHKEHQDSYSASDPHSLTHIPQESVVQRVIQHGRLSEGHWHLVLGCVMRLFPLRFAFLITFDSDWEWNESNFPTTHLPGKRKPCAVWKEMTHFG